MDNPSRDDGVESDISQPPFVVPAGLVCSGRLGTIVPSHEIQHPQTNRNEAAVTRVCLQSESEAVSHREELSL
jgi:hypothetical protein